LPTVILVLLSLLALATGLAIYVGGRLATLEWLLQKAVTSSGGTLTISGARGSLYGPLHIDRISVRSPEQVISAEQIDIDWQPRQLLTKQIAIRRVQVAALTVDNLMPSTQPLVMPSSLSLPLALQADEVRIGKIAISASGSRTQLDDLRLRLKGDASGWRMQDASLGTPWGKLAANATLRGNRPFAVDGKFRFTAPRFAGDLQGLLRGDLGSLAVDITARSHAANASATLNLAPFDAVPLHALSIKVRQIDPAAWDAAWPQADLGLDLTLALGATPDHRVSGNLALTNSATPGPINLHRLPLRAISTSLGGTLAALRFNDVMLDLAQAGKLHGNGSIVEVQEVQPQNKPGRAVTLQLHTDGVDVQAIHSRLHRSKIAGDIVLGQRGAMQTLQAALAQDGLRFDMQATLADGWLRLQQARLRAGASDVQLRGELQLRDDKSVNPANSANQPPPRQTIAQAFKASGAISHFNPAQFGAFPAADVNTGLSLEGNLAPVPQVRAQFTLQPSRFLNQALSGHGTLAADPQHVRGVDIALSLGGNAIEAHGDFGAPADRLTWRIDGKQLAALRAGLDGALRASGTLSGSMAAPSTSFDVNAHGLSWHATNAQASASSGSLLQAQGQIALGGEGDFKFKGMTQRFNPAAFGPYPAASLNATVDASGRIGAPWRVALDLQLAAASTFLNAPLSGHVVLNADSAHISNADLDLHLAENQLQARGNVGAAKDQLDWHLDAPRLAAFGAQFGGALQANGNLSGSLALPALTLMANGRALQLPGQIKLQTVRASARMTAGLDSALQAEIDLSALESPQWTLQSAHLRASGTRAAHTLGAAVRGPGFDTQLELAGGWNPEHGWSGLLRSLQNSGDIAFTLQAPAPLRISDFSSLQQFSINDAQVNIAGGSLTLKALEKSGAHWRTSGQARALPLSLLRQLAPTLRDKLDGDLTLGASWMLDLDQSINGSLRLFREGGDVTAGIELPLALGLRQLEARADIAGNALQVQVDVAGVRAGRLHLEAASQLARRDGRWGLPGASALTLRGSADMPSIAWLAPLSGQPGLELDGKLALDVRGSGSIGAPQLAGSLNGDNLTLRWTSQGLKLRNGVLRAQLAGDQLQVQSFHIDGEQGSAQASGWVRFADAALTMQIKASADKLLVLSRPDRLLVLSGQGNVSLDQKRVQLDGKFKAERATIELASQSGVTISDDIVVHGASVKAVKPTMSLPINIDIEADLGDQFNLKGFGLDAQLTGKVQVRAIDRRAPRALGSVSVVKGTYAAYGQKLQITNGVINFTGPLDNPGLSILAVRKPTDDAGVEAGVEVRGTALAPQARLVSTPSVPDSEKLSWLVLGHGSEGTTGQEFDLLGAAAGALLGGKQSGLQARVASTLGLDEIGVSRAKGLESTVLTVGKRISSRAYLSFEQGVGSASGLAKLRYSLNSRVSVQVQSGTNNAVDVFYTWKFD
jgi:translocation and assembly module TamB